jgi:Secretion system C-terminal sorting domain
MKKLITICLLAFVGITSINAQWNELGNITTMIKSNTNIRVVFRDTAGNIYVGGDLINSSGKSYVAKFDGTTWSELGGANSFGASANGGVYTICSDKYGNIYAAGQFRNSSGNFYVAKFNGTTWSELVGSNSLAANNIIYSICSDPSGNIYAAGEFFKPNPTGNPAVYESSVRTYVAKFDGTSWSELPSQLNQGYVQDPIYTICSDVAGNIYAPSSYTLPTNERVATVAKFSGSSWTRLSGYTYKNYGSVIKSICVDGGGNVYASGDIRTTTGKRYVAKYSGSAWAAVGGTDALAANNAITSISLDAANNLYAAGGFTNSSGNYYVAKYNGTNWTELGGTNALAANTQIMSICSDAGGNVFATGQFYKSAVGFNYTYVAKYNNPCTPTSSTTNASICSGSSYSFNGNSYNATGTYTATLRNAGGCDSVATLNLTVTPLNVTGASSICIGSSITLTPNFLGGVWSSRQGRAIVNSSGVVTGTSAGTAIIFYTVVNATCAGTVSKTITVNSLPNVPSIGYAPASFALNPQRGPGGAFCNNRTFTLVGNPTGGIWSRTGVITVDATKGILNTGSSAGAATLTYTYTNANGCSNSRTINGTVAVCLFRGVNGIENGKLSAAANENDFTIFPNPAKSFISLNVKTLMGAGTIVVNDLYGKQVKAQSLSMGTNTIDIANLAKGIYFVSTITSEGKTTKKLVVE